ncbi:cytochrome c biogenesis protein ResB [Streptomyces radicis]|uniref:Cytochrome c biogenesis protein ResB n=1 Tax=Streptomyces radicis TaxID=1750517 RepID=A0A3A9WUI7_9ACTN|nr:cytochrome c biogenesis protein ResB [Streptomyces radicis]RKN09787.1 cytochrome c biogenesis protein ResB [Streptomyces radicis]RKN23424.1 cytochrome c biogenesis protein ResB [Streptomyces radicis]
MTDDTQQAEAKAAGAGARRDAERSDDAAALAGLSTAPVDEADDAQGGEGAAGAGAGSFGGRREPGARGALAWLGRECAGWARWFWRQLTSMRVALILLFLLALASIPGSMIPQDNVNAPLAEDFRERNEALSEFYEAFQLFDVYSSVWFSAIYLLLFISLIGCIVPRTWQFVGQLRARPPRAPRRLNRMPAYTTWRTDTPPDEVLAAAQRRLRRRRFRADLREDGPGGAHVAAEKGYLREAGNLAFHLALIVMLVAFAAGRLWYSEGGKLVVQGEGFSNTLTQYDDFESGTLFDVNELEPFGFRLDEFHSDFSRETVDLGTPTLFRADVTWWDQEGAEREAEIEVNDPLHVGDSRVRLLGHGYAPVVTVMDAQGELAFHGPVPFLPQDTTLTSTGVIKVSTYTGPDGEPDQLGFQGFFNPTYNIDAERGPHSTFPEPDLPVLTLNAFHGDLGVNSGLPQNVYQLDTSDMEQLRDEETGDLFRFNLVPGQSIELPDGMGTLTFDRLEQWASFQITTKAGNEWALASSLAAVGGLAASLLLQRRRVWVRAFTGDDGHTVVEMASLGRTESAKVPEELADLAERLRPDAPLVPDEAATPADETADPAEPAESAESAAAEGARP